MRKLILPCLFFLIISFGVKGQHYAKYGITVAGQKNGTSGSDIIHLNSPAGVCADDSGNIYVADLINSRVQKWGKGSTYGVTVAGNTNGKYGSDSLSLNGPEGIFIDSIGNIYVADVHNNRVQKWAKGAQFGITVAGSKDRSSGVDSAHLYEPTGVYVDNKGNVYVADYLNNRVQKWPPGSSYGITVAGQSNGIAGSDSFHLNYPFSIYLDKIGNMYVAEGDNRIKKWKLGDKYGITVAGDGKSGSTATEFNGPAGIFVDNEGNIYVADGGNQRIQKWEKGKSYGITVAGSRDGIENNDSAHLSYPNGVFVGHQNNIYIADASNNRIQKWFVKNVDCDAYSIAITDSSLKATFVDYSVASGHKSRYSWTFGDGTTDTSKNPIHLYKHQGTFNVTEKINDSAKTCSSQYNSSITVGIPYCKAEFTYYYDTLKGFQFVDLSTGTRGKVKYYWNFGDLSKDTVQNPIYGYAQKGKYIVSLFIIDSGCYSYYTDTVKVPDTCNASYHYIVDLEGYVTFVNASIVSHGKPNYKWYFGDGDTSLLVNPSHKFDTTYGGYITRLVVTDSGCQSYYSSTVKDDSFCRVMAHFITYIDTSLTVAFFDSSFTRPKTDFFVHKWFFGDGAIDTVPNPIHKYLIPGIYNVSEAIYDHNLWTGGCYTSYNTTINVPSIYYGCFTYFNAQTDTTLTAVFKDSLSNKGITPKYFWDFGDGTIDSIQNTKHTYTKPGIYSVCIYALKRDSLGNTYCYYCDSIRVGKFYGLGNHEVMGNLKLRIFPNPVNNTLNVYLPDNVNEGTLHIKNILGQDITTQRTNGRVAVLDMSSLAQGIYLIQLQTMQGMFITKVIKQ